MTSDPQYEYSPIIEADGIRLIELQPAQDASAPLRCSLIPKKLSLCGDSDIFGHYIALSYVWGNPEKSKTILVDGRPLGITSNLHSALLDLRDEKRTLMIWADGVCINQGDNAEKAMQIGLMGQIYATAPHTIIYLCPAGSTDPESVGLASIQEGTYLGTEEKLGSVFMKEWFTRVWVFQELVFSKRPWLQCGRTRIQWDLLFNILRWDAMQSEVVHSYGGESTQADAGNTYNILVWLDEGRYRIIRDMQRARKHHLSLSSTEKVNDDTPSWESQPSANSMLEILGSRRSFAATDPRDMIFAHVGFASDGQHENLAVDYSKTTVQVYESSALYIARIFGLSTLLDCVGRGDSQERISGLPSWVPDWTCKIPTKSYTTQDFSRETTPILPELIPILLREPETGILPRIFSRFDTVCFTSSTLSVHRIPWESRQSISSRLKGLDSNGEFFVPSIDQERDLLNDIYQVWSDWVDDQTFLLPDLPKVDKNASWYPFGWIEGNVPVWFFHALKEGPGTEYLDGRRPARMESGRLALVPESAQEEDIIAVLDGNGPAGKGILHYLFHPIQLDGGYSRIDDRIHWSAKQAIRNSVNLEHLKLKAMMEKIEVELAELSERRTLHLFSGNMQKSNARTEELEKYERKMKELKRVEARAKEFEAPESLVLHCKFIGECVIRQESQLFEPQQYNLLKSTGVIVAIH